MIEETKAEGRRRSYRITPAGQSALEAEYRRLRVLVTDYEAASIKEGLRNEKHKTRTGVLFLL